MSTFSGSSVIFSFVSLLLHLVVLLVHISLGTYESSTFHVFMFEFVSHGLHDSASFCAGFPYFSIHWILLDARIPVVKGMIPDFSIFSLPTGPQ